jgi:Ca2+-binding RTX toxin-like protein
MAGRGTPGRPVRMDAPHGFRKTTATVFAVTAVALTLAAGTVASSAGADATLDVVTSPDPGAHVVVPDIASGDVTLLGPGPVADAQLKLPGLVIEEIEVLGPTTARVTGYVDPGTLATKVHFEYGSGGVLNQVTPSITLDAGADPTKIVADLLDLQPGTDNLVRLVAETSEGAVSTSFKAFSTDTATSVSLSSGAPAASGKRAYCTILGTGGKDKLVGTSRRDVICGLGGNDKIVARGGNDVVIAGGGRDTVTGGAGSDQIRGNSAGDSLAGNGGNDRINGGSGKDRISGGAGRDRVSGDGGNDRLTGNGGRDRVQGSSGNDRLTSRDRRKGDVVSGGRGRDRATVDRRDRVSSVERVSRR